MNSIIVVLALLLNFAEPSSLPSKEKTRCQGTKIVDYSKFKDIKQCNIIEGSLWLEDLIISKNDSLPNLIEITDYLVMHDVSGLESLPYFLPRLSFVRGRKLYKGYGMVLEGVCSHEFCESKDADYNPGVIHLKNIKNWSFVKVLRGGIWLESNKLVCFQGRGYWKDYVGQSYKEVHYKNNLEYCPFIYCNGPNCHFDAPKICEKLKHACPYKEMEDKDEICHPTCLEGKCTLSEDPSSCTACKHYEYEGSCVEHCPINTLNYFDYRCISPEACQLYNFTIHYKKESGLLNGKCVNKCPNGFVPKRVNETSPFFCNVRNDSDPCSSKILKNGDLADSLRYCISIDGNLEINIDKNLNKNDTERLSKNLANLKNITGRLRIVGANIFYSLYFLNNLQYIGEKVNASAAGEASYALFILNNLNLKELFGPKSPNEKLIINGPILIKFNEMLCEDTIEEFNRTALQPMNNDFVSEHNGKKAQCFVTTTNLYVAPGPRLGTAILKFFHNHCGNVDLYIIGYNVYYREAPAKSTLSRYEGRSACADSWSMDRIALEDGIDPGCFEYTVGNLSTNTRYAFYIESFGLIEDKLTIRSDIAYCTTFPERPECPREGQATLETSKKASHLDISWKSPGDILGHQLFYEIKVIWTSLNNDALNGTCDDFDNQLKMLELSEKLPSKCILRSNISHSQTEHCPCKNKFPPISYHRDRVELIRIIHKDLHLPDYSLPKTYTPSQKRCPFSRDDLLSCSTIQQNFGDSDFSHKELLTYVKNQFDLTQSTTNEFMRVSVPKEFYRYRTTMQIRSCMENLTECQNVGISSPCAFCSEFSTFQYKASHVKIEYLSNLTVTLVEPRNEGNSSLKKLNISWEVNEENKDLILGYKLSYGISNSPKEILCFSTLDAELTERTHYELSLQNTGAYQVDLIPITMGNTKGIKASFEIAGANVFKNLTFDIFLAFGIVGVLLFTIMLAMGLIFYQWHTDPKFHIVANEGYKEHIGVNPNDVKILKIIGTGNFGIVYKALLREDTYVAVKTLKTPEGKEDWALFDEELDIAKVVDNSFIENLIGHVNDLKNPQINKNPALYGIFDLCEGSLVDYLQKCSRDLTQIEVAELLVQLADAMSYLHHKGIVHRDIAARNVLMMNFRDEFPLLKLSDFGLARYLIKSGYYVLGTKTKNSPIAVPFASPEILDMENCKHTKKSDVYSFGILVYQVAARQMPYGYIFGTLDPGVKKMEKLKEIIMAEVKKYSRVPSPLNSEDMDHIEKEYPYLTRKITSACLQIEPENRPSFMEIEEHLLELARPHFHKWFSSKTPFIYKFQEETQKAAEEAESCFCQNSPDMSEGQSLKSEYEDQPDRDDQRLMSASPDAQGVSCFSCISTTPQLSEFSVE